MWPHLKIESKGEARSLRRGNVKVPTRIPYPVKFPTEREGPGNFPTPIEKETACLHRVLNMNYNAHSVIEIFFSSLYGQRNEKLYYELACIGVIAIFSLRWRG